MYHTELMTLASESCSQALVGAHCLPVLLDLVVQTNRSQPSLVVVAGIIRILHNINKVCILIRHHSDQEVYVI